MIASLLGRGEEIIALDVNFSKNNFLICDLFQGEGKKGCRSKARWGRSLFSDLLLDQHGSARCPIGLNPSQKLAVVTYFHQIDLFSPQTGSESGNQGKRKAFGGEVCSLSIYKSKTITIHKKKVFGGEVCNLSIYKYKMFTIHCNLSIYKFKNLKCS